MEAIDGGGDGGGAPYWIVDCTAESVEVCRTRDAGRYREVSRMTAGGSVAPQAFPDVVLTLADIFA